MTRTLLLALPVASAVLVSLSFPSVDLGFLAWFGLAPLLFALRQSRPPAAAGLGFLFGFLYAGGVFYWLGGIAVMTVPRTLLMYVAFATYYLVFGLLYSLVSRATGSWIVVGGPALWMALEYARSSLGFLALPWNLLVHSQYRYLPLIQIADVTGVYGISFLIVMVNQLLSQVPALVAQRRPPSPTGIHRTTWAAPLLVVAGSLLLTLGYGWYRLAAPEGAERVRVALVQANLLTRDDMPIRDMGVHLQAYERLTKEAASSHPDLIVWPSSSLPAPIRFMPVNFFVRNLAQETGTYLLVGGAGGDKFARPHGGYLPYSNSEFLVSPLGAVEGQYNKIQLTPFTEYVPLRGKIRWPQWITGLTESFVPGTEYKLFRVGGARFGAPICWENTFPDLFRQFVRHGANLMISVTNEGFFGRTSGLHQTLAMNVFRAVENRVAVVRAATTGVSAFISPKGEILGRVTDADGNDLFVSGILVRDVPLSSERTFYTLHGDVFAQAVTALAAVLTLASLLPARWTVRIPVPGTAARRRIPASR